MAEITLLLSAACSRPLPDNLVRVDMLTVDITRERIVKGEMR